MVQKSQTTTWDVVSDPVNNGIVDHYQPQLVSSPDFLVAINSLGTPSNHQKWSPQRKTRSRGYDIAQVREHDHLELLEVKKRWVESGGKVGSVFSKQKSWEVGIFFS